VIARVAVLLALMGAPAFAQPAGKTSRAEAEQFFRAGERAFKQNAFESAADMFERAYATLPLPAIAFSAAQAYRLQHALDGDPRKLKRAVELYEKYVAEDPKGKRVGDAAKILAELRPRLDEIEKKGKVGEMPAVRNATMIVVTTTTDIPDARLSIDGGAPEPLNVMREIKPGRHKIRVTAAGYFPFDEAREIIEGEVRPIEAELRPRPAVVRVRAAEGSQVSVNGRPAGVTPLVRPLELPPGRHLVTVTRRGHQPWSRELQVARGQAVELDAAPGRTGQRTVSYVVLGAAGLLALGAGVTYSLSLVAASDADDLNDKRNREGLSRDEARAYDDAVDRREARLGNTWLLLGAGAAVATTGLLLYFMDNPRAEASGGFTMAAGSDGESVGLAVGGRF
jgi:hypothetical protein